jgi:hypothetical protein
MPFNRAINMKELVGAPFARFSHLNELSGADFLKTSSVVELFSFLFFFSFFFPLAREMYFSLGATAAEHLSVEGSYFG